MQAWKQLLKHAVIGTHQQAFILPDTLPAALEGLRERLSHASAEQQMLHLSALLDAYQSAAKPAPTGLCVMPKAAPESRPCCSAKLKQLGREILAFCQTQRNSVPLLAEYLQTLYARGERLPFEMLPNFFEQGVQSADLRPLLARVSGQRGAWLAQQNSVWAWLQSEHFNPQQQMLWQTGNINARYAWLCQCREQAPDLARDLLAEQWQQGSAKERQQLLQALWINLSLADESFLLACQTDRSQVIRRQACQMLGSLAESAYTQAALERLSAYIRFDSKSQQLQVELPSEFDSAWQAEGIQKKYSHSHLKIGERMGWLYQLLLSVRPDLWCAHLGLSIRDYFNSLQQHEDAKILRMALREGIEAFQDSALFFSCAQQTPYPFWRDLLATHHVQLSQAQAEQLLFPHLLDVLGRLKKDADWQELIYLLGYVPALNREQSEQVLATFNRLKEKKDAGKLSHMLKNALSLNKDKIVEDLNNADSHPPPNWLLTEACHLLALKLYPGERDNTLEHINRLLTFLTENFSAPERPQESFSVPYELRFRLWKECQS